MTLVQLRHLLLLAETGSFSRSSALLFITQPALSRSIQALEAELGQPLFDRVGRRSELTPFGRRAVERARDLVQAAYDQLKAQQAATQAAGQAAAENTPENRVSATNAGRPATSRTSGAHCENVHSNSSESTNQRN